MPKQLAVNESTLPRFQFVYKDSESAVELSFRVIASDKIEAMETAKQVVASLRRVSCFQLPENTPLDRVLAYAATLPKE